MDASFRMDQPSTSVITLDDLEYEILPFYPLIDDGEKYIILHDSEVFFRLCKDGELWFLCVGLMWTRPCKSHFFGSTN